MQKQFFFFITIVILLLLINPIKSLKWEIKKTQGTIPLTTENVFQCKCEKYKNSLFVYGGRKSPTKWSSVMNKLNLETGVWESVSDVNPYPSLGEHSMTRIGNKFFIYGGRSSVFDYKNNMYVFDPHSSVMELIKTTGSNPTGLRSHSATAVGKEIYIFGGVMADAKINNELYIFNIETKQWRKPMVFGDKPQGAKGHSALMFGNKLFIFGGVNNNLKAPKFQTAIYYLNTNNLNWKKVEKGLRARAFHNSVAKDQYVFITGGFDGNRRLGDSKIFNLVTLEWMDKIQIENFEKPIHGHCGMLYKNSVFLFGGALDWHHKYNDVIFLETKDFSSKFKSSGSWMINDEEDMSSFIEAAMLKISMLFDTDTFDQKKGKAIEDEIKAILKKYEGEDKDLTFIEKKIGEWKETEILYNSVENSIQNMQSLRGNVQVDIDEIDSVKKNYLEIRKIVEKGQIEMKKRLKEIKAVEYRGSVEKDKLKETKFEYDAADQKVSDLKNEIAKIRNQLSPLKINIKKKFKEIESLEVSKTKSQKTFEAYENRFNELKKRNTTSLANIGKFTQQKEKLIKVIYVSEKDHGLLTKQYDQLKASILKNDTVVAKTDDLKETLSKVVELMRVYRKKRAQLLKEGDKKDEKTGKNDPFSLIASDNEMKALDEKVKSEQKKLNNERKRITIDKEVLERNLKKFKRELNDVVGKLRANEMTSEIALRDIAKITGKRISERNVMQVLEKKWLHAVEIRGQLREKQRALNSTLANLLKTLEGLKKDVLKKRGTYKNQVKIESEARDSISDLKTNLKRKLSDFLSSVTSYETIVSDLQSRRHEITASHSSVLDQEKLVDEYKRELNKKVKEIKKEHETKVAALEKKIETLNKLLKEKK